MQPIEVGIRNYDSRIDDPYIYSSWTRYAWYSPEQTISKNKRQWFADKTLEIKAILSQETVRVACFKNNPYVIVGYIVVKDHDITWICVKKDYHNQGIEKLLENSMKGRLHDSQVNEERSRVSSTKEPVSTEII